MKDTVTVQKDMMKEMNVDSVMDVMDDMRDIMDDQAEISEALQRNYDIDVGDEELDQELDELDRQMMVDMDAKELCVPNKRVMTKREQDEKDLESMLNN